MEEYYPLNKFIDRVEHKRQILLASTVARRFALRKVRPGEDSPLEVSPLEVSPLGRFAHEKVRPSFRNFANGILAFTIYKGFGPLASFHEYYIIY